MSESPARADTVAGIAELYLGNILFALERTAMALEADGEPGETAAFYRGIARKLAEARGKEKARTANGGGRAGCSTDE